MMCYPDPFRLSPSATRRRQERDSRDGFVHLTHAKGLCGAAVAACCSECFEDEAEELTLWARTAPDPRPGEDACDYWRRLSNAVCGDSITRSSIWGDAWYQVASHRVRECRQRRAVA